MTREDIIRMAREAGMEVHERKSEIRIGSALFTASDCTEQVERFAALVRQDEQIRQMKNAEELAELVRQDEREACAKICDGWSKREDDVGGYIGRAIRARGQV